MGRLSGKIAVVTGGTTGIGLSTARLFAAEGAKVVATGRNAQSLAAAREELRGVAEVVQSDAGNPAEVRRLFEEIGKQYSRIDVLFLTRASRNSRRWRTRPRSCSTRRFA